MRSTRIQSVLTGFRSVLLLALISFGATAACAQMSNQAAGGSLGGGGLSGSRNNFAAIANANSDEDPSGIVNNAIRRGCVDSHDPNAAESGLPTCPTGQNSADDNAQDDSEQDPNSAGAGSSTLSAGRTGPGCANSINKQSVSAIIQRLGISPDELGSLKGEMASKRSTSASRL